MGGADRLPLSRIFFSPLYFPTTAHPYLNGCARWCRTRGSVMNIREALDIGGAILIALGSLPLAAAIARVALKVLMAALAGGQHRIPT